ncbi:MAG: aminodeoxychorismate/anthranilate synthase component II [Planctomycetota bacterium]
MNSPPYACLPPSDWHGRVLVIDNEDSFAHNLAHALAMAGARVAVVRHDRTTVSEVHRSRPCAVVLSPGPRTPESFPVTLELAHMRACDLPTFGVCLGLQAIGLAFGARLVRAPRPMHGRQSLIRHDGAGLFRGLASPLVVGRYHSLVIDPRTLPETFEVTAWSTDGQIMACRHKQLSLHAVQFHPESYLTHGGIRLLANFLALCAPSASELAHA